MTNVPPIVLYIFLLCFTIKTITKVILQNITNSTFLQLKYLVRTFTFLDNYSFSFSSFVYKVH